MFVLTRRFMFNGYCPGDGMAVFRVWFIFEQRSDELAVEPEGSVVKMDDLDVIGRWLKDNLDGQNLDRVTGREKATPEQVAYFIYHRWKGEFPALETVRLMCADSWHVEYRHFKPMHERVEWIQGMP